MVQSPILRPAQAQNVDGQMNAQTRYEKRLAEMDDEWVEISASAKRYLASIGSKGGKAKSRAKTAAAKANGKFGGRPKTKRVTRRANDQAER